MEVLLVLYSVTQWHIGETYLEYIVYIFFRMSFAYFACQEYLNLQNPKVNKLKIEDIDSFYNIYKMTRYE